MTCWRRGARGRDAARGVVVTGMILAIFLGGISAVFSQAVAQCSQNVSSTLNGTCEMTGKILFNDSLSIFQVQNLAGRENLIMYSAATSGWGLVVVDGGRVRLHGNAVLLSVYISGNGTLEVLEPCALPMDSGSRHTGPLHMLTPPLGRNR